MRIRRTFSKVALANATLLLFGLLEPGAANASNIRLEWLGSAGTTCPNLGIHGAYRGFAIINGDVTATGFRVATIVAYANSAAVQRGRVVLSGKAEVVVDDEVLETIPLGPPTQDVLGPERGANETNRIYSRHDADILAPPGASLRVTLSPLLERTSGNCALGTSSEITRLPHRQGGPQP